MKRLILVLTVLAIGVFASALPRPAAALHNWPALLGCADLNADGIVSVGDIGLVVSVFTTSYLNTPDDYLLLYDVSGEGVVSVGDIGTVVADFTMSCSLMDKQVGQATLAMTGAYGGPDLRDPQNALDAGYIMSSQDVPAMGIHLFNQGYLAQWPNCCSLGLPGEPGESQLIHPVGLVYTADSSGPMGLGVLIGAWYIRPNDVVCDFYVMPTPCQSASEQPVGFGEFNDDEDNFDPDGSGVQSGWHFHLGLCIWNWDTASAFVLENQGEQNCEGSGGMWFSNYGWMVHLYNFIPNAAGRFQKWNFENLP